jgi:hypothetical protein
MDVNEHISETCTKFSINQSKLMIILDIEERKKEDNRRTVR